MDQRIPSERGCGPTPQVNCKIYSVSISQLLMNRIDFRTVEQSETELAGALVSVYCLVGIAIGPILSLLLWKVI